MSGGTLVLQFGPLIRKLRMILRNPPPMPQAIRYSYQSQMGTSILVEVPSPFVGPSEDGCSRLEWSGCNAIRIHEKEATRIPAAGTGIVLEVCGLTRAADRGSEVRSRRMSTFEQTRRRRCFNRYTGHTNVNPGSTVTHSGTQNGNPCAGINRHERASLTGQRMEL